jgi:hypothetical protein
VNPCVLHRLRTRARRIAAATVALFALNWLGLALMPCAMAYAAPAEALPAAAASASAAMPSAMPEGCPGHAGAAATQADAPAGEPCPWCLQDGPSQGHANADCGATPKPALDSRDAKNPVTPLLVALSATVLGFLPVDGAQAADWDGAAPALPPDQPLSDRYCRRLE